MIRWFFLLLLLFVAKLLGSLDLSQEAQLGFQASMAFGFLILAGFLAGEAARKIYLPAITGYMLAGLVCGPYVMGVLSHDVVQYLQPIDQLALFFIALTAGAELKADVIRSQWKAVSAISLSQLVLGGLFVHFLLMLLAPWLPVLSDLQGLPLAAAVALLAIVSTAKSPATTVAVIVETRAQGPLRDLTLAVTVLMDVLVIIAFTLVIGWAGTVLGGAAEYHLLHELWMIAFSILVGIAFGLLLIQVMHRLEKNMSLVILFGALLLVQVCNDLHLDALILAVSAGYVVSNHSRHGHVFLESLESVAQPIFLAFFGLAGAMLDISLLGQLWPLALLLVSLRLAAKFSSVSLVARYSNLPRQIKGPLWMGFLGQAGVSLGFAAIIASDIPTVGKGLREIIVVAVVLNQLLGPILFKMALVKTGEVGKAVEDRSVHTD